MIVRAAYWVKGWPHWGHSSVPGSWGLGAEISKLCYISRLAGFCPPPPSLLTTFDQSDFLINTDLTISFITCSVLGINLFFRLPKPQVLPCLPFSSIISQCFFLAVDTFNSVQIPNSTFASHCDPLHHDSQPMTIFSRMASTEHLLLGFTCFLGTMNVSSETISPRRSLCLSVWLLVSICLPHYYLSAPWGWDDVVLLPPAV